MGAMISSYSTESTLPTDKMSLEEEKILEVHQITPTTQNQSNLQNFVNTNESLDFNVPATLISPEKTVLSTKLTSLDTVMTDTMEVDEEKLDEILHPAKKSKCVKTLSDGHTAIRVNLDKAMQELSDKVELSKDLKEEVASQRLTVWMYEESLRSITEKYNLLLESLSKSQKEQDSLFEELVDMRWKTREANRLATTISSKLHTTQEKCFKFKNELGRLENLESKMNPTKNETKAQINQLQLYKSGLENGDAQLCSINNGNKMLEIEQRRRAIHNAINERPARFESMVAVIKEKEDAIELQKKSLENVKEVNQTFIKRQKGHELYLSRTERRLQRGLDYYKAKIDYGVNNVPPPPPWF